MKCPYCNSENIGEDNVCRECGKKMPDQKDIVKKISPASKKEIEKKSKAATSIYDFGVVILVIGIIFAILLLIEFENLIPPIITVIISLFYFLVLYGLSQIINDIHYIRAIKEEEYKNKKNSTDEK